MEKPITVVTAGSTYLDIDAYACCVAMAELLRLKGENAIAYSAAPANYSVCDFLTEDGQMAESLSEKETAEYIIVDVSDPAYIKDAVPLERVVAVYDHHVGFEDYWKARIGDGTHIAFIGAAATLIFREWKAAGLQERMSRSTALLLVAAILDNTLNLTSANTTPEDVDTFRRLCRQARIGQEWCAGYFSQVQKSVEADLKNALFTDLKRVHGNPILPQFVAQLCVWDTESVLARLPQIRQWFAGMEDWLINIIDLQRRCSYFLCDREAYQTKISRAFGVRFENGIAQTERSYLRKEIIKKTLGEAL